MTSTSITVLKLMKKRPLISLCATGWVGVIGAAVVVEANTHRKEYVLKQRNCRDRLQVQNEQDESTIIPSNQYAHELREESIVGGLPRQYDKAAIDKYWSARPVSVALRGLEMAYELGPRFIAGVWDFGIVPFLLVAPRRTSTTTKNQDSELLQQEQLELQLQQQQQQQHEEEQELLKRHARQFCEALMNLGPAFVKVGQQLSIRPDILPPIVLKELQTLCDAVRPITDDVAWQVLRQEWQVEDLSGILEGDLQRVASASLGQVYKAKLRETGEEVAIKIQRPDMLESFSLDLYLLQWIGVLMDGFCVTFTKQSPYHQNMLDTFSRGSYSELDYELEAENQIRFQRELAHMRDRVVIPRVYTNYTTRRILVTQWIDGIRLVDASPDVIQKMIPVGLELFLTQLLDMGLFHADGHPGNLLVTNHGTALCLLDFGLCVQVQEPARRAMTKAIWHLMRGDVDALLSEDAKELGFLPRDFDTTELKPIFAKILYTVQSPSPSSNDINNNNNNNVDDDPESKNKSSSSSSSKNKSALQRNARKFMDISNELNQVFFQYPFSVPPFFALVTRGLSLLEGVALSGDPNFNILRASAPFARRRVAALWNESPSLLSRLTSSKKKKK